MKDLIYGSGYWCNHCKSGVQYSEESLDKMISNIGVKKTLNQTIKCTNCGHEFYLYNGIIENLVSERIWPDFICDVLYFGETEIVVGKEFKISLPEKFLINKVFLTNGKGFAAIAPRYIDHLESDTFSIVSSQIDSNHPDAKKMGEKHTVSWTVYGKSGEKYNDTWIQLLAQIKEQITYGQYNIAVLTSEMMFESFLDSTLTKLLKNEGLSNEAAYIILESMSNIYRKVHKLLGSLNGQGLNDSKEINKEWVKLMELRNKIGHGEEVEVDKETAKWAMRTALNAIFFIYNTSSVYQ